MRFDEVIENLYSSDDELICEVLNEGLHVTQCNKPDDAVSTGFQCKTHKGTIFDVKYLISQQKVCYMKSLSPKCRSIIGAPSKYDPDLRLNNDYFYYHTGFSLLENDKDIIWYDSYDIESNQFNQVKIKDVNQDDDEYITNLILDGDVNISSFLVHSNDIEIQSYPLFSAYVPILYKSGTFSPIIDVKNRRISYGGADTSWDDYGVSCERYNGYNGWSDDLIDDVFGGIPEATWNVD